MRSQLDALVTQKSLNLILSGSESLDLIDDLQSRDIPILKNVCAKVSVSLSDSIDGICGLLNISKRRFLEVAFIDAVQRAHEIMEREGVWEALQEHTQKSQQEQSDA